MLAGMEEVGTGLLDRLDAMQRVAASRAGRPAADRRRPGHRQDPHADPPHRVPLRRAGRLPAPLPGDHLHPAGRRRTAGTPGRPARRRRRGHHGRHVPLGRPDASSRRTPRRPGSARTGGSPTSTERTEAREQAGDDDAAYAKLLRQQDLVDLDDLITLPVELLRDEPALVEKYRRQWQWIFVDEYQDVDETQYELLRLLSPAGRQPVRDRRPGPGDLLVPRRRRDGTSCASTRTSWTPAWSG